MTGYCTISKWFYNCNFSVLNSTFIAFYFFYSILLNSTFSVLNSTGVMCRHQYHKVVIKLFNKRNYNLPNFLCLLSVTVVRTLCFCHLLAVQDWESQFTSLHLSHRRRQWHSTLALLPEKSHGRRGLATHSSVLAWRIPGMEEPGGLPSMGSHRVRHDWSNLAAAAAAWG